MNASEGITPFHLGRQALIYIRQSSPHQALTNQESLKLQYALRWCAQEHGWAAAAIEVIDSDLGCTASTTEGRQGFKDLVARVTQDQVGIIFAYDVTRLARNCTDWYQLLDLCGYRHCLVGDQDRLLRGMRPQDGRVLQARPALPLRFSASTPSRCGLSVSAGGM
jgi:DNA invertase Pin-like site-specific DNA recombinase